jgi:CubicO group peptidase (beta-lactamase class C family)
MCRLKYISAIRLLKKLVNKSCFKAIFFLSLGCQPITLSCFMKSAIFSILFAFILFFRFDASAQSVDSTKIWAVERDIRPTIQLEGDTPMTIKQRMAFYKVKGMSVAVVQNYKVIWAKGYGFADDSLKSPVMVHTLFQAGSISKSLNSVGIMKLVQEKKIDLYADINTYLISWKFPYDSLSKGKKISTANLLSHTAGLTVHGFEGYTNGKPIPTIIQTLNGQKPANSPAIRSMYAPGLQYQYSGGGVTISQLILMDVTHQPYAPWMYANVLKPMGMTESTYEQPPVSVKPGLLATGYRSNGKEIPGRYNVYPEQAAAGLWTNPTDLSKYIIETQLAYAGKSHKVLNQQTTQLRLTPYVDKSAALGCFIEDLDSVKYFTHDGADEGFRAEYYGSIEGGNGVVVMVNSDNGNIMPEVASSIARVYGFKGLNRTKLKKIVAVPDTLLQKYIGVYEVEPGFTLTITRVGDTLYGQGTNQARLQLYAEAQNKFFLKVADADIEFTLNDKGEVIRAVLYQNGVRELKRL